MKDPRTKETLSAIMKIPRKIETVIGQLKERFDIQAIKEKDMWHLAEKIARKILSHYVAFMFMPIQMALEMLS